MGREYLEKEYQERQFKGCMDRYEREIAFACIVCGEEQSSRGTDLYILCRNQHCIASYDSATPNFLLIDANAAKVHNYLEGK